MSLEKKGKRPRDGKGRESGADVREAPRLGGGGNGVKTGAEERGGGVKSSASSTRKGTGKGRGPPLFGSGRGCKKMRTQKGVRRKPFTGGLGMPAWKPRFQGSNKGDSQCNQTLRIIEKIR